MRTATALFESTRAAGQDAARPEGALTSSEPWTRVRRAEQAGWTTPPHHAGINDATASWTPSDPLLRLGYQVTADVRGIAPSRLAALLQDVHTRFSEHRTSAQIARAHGLSAGMLRAFRIGSGRTLHQYLTVIRIIHAVRALALTDDKVSAIADSVGYRSKKDFYHALRQHCGLLPKALRARPTLERLKIAATIAEQLLKLRSA